MSLLDKESEYKGIIEHITSERDSLRAKVDRLKAELDNYRKRLANTNDSWRLLSIDRDAWKQKYEEATKEKTQFCVNCETYARKAEALAVSMNNIIWMIDVAIQREGSSEGKVRIKESAETALAEYRGAK